MQNICEFAKVSLANKKAGATIFCTNLVLDKRRKVVFLTGFGPSQEVRAFSQLLSSGNATLEAKNRQGEQVVFQRNCQTGQKIWLRGSMGDQRIIFVTPADHTFIVQDDLDSCAEIFYRHLNQNHFVHAEWYKALFQELQSLEPLVGSKVCFQADLNIEKLVREGIASGKFRFPEPTATLDISVEDKGQAA